MSVTFFKNGLKWLGYMYIKGFWAELASYRNLKSNRVSGKCANAHLLTLTEGKGGGNVRRLLGELLQVALQVCLVSVPGQLDNYLSNQKLESK